MVSATNLILCYMLHVLRMHAVFIALCKHLYVVMEEYGLQKKYDLSYDNVALVKSEFSRK